MKALSLQIIAAATAGMLTLTAAPASHAQAQSQTREDGAPAYSLGLGDSGRASATGATALYFNPAGIARLRQYSIEAGYSFMNAVDGHSFGVAAVDSATNDVLSMGMAYNYLLSNVGGRDRDGHNLRGGVATAYRGDGFSIMGGVGLRYTSLVQGAYGDKGEEDLEFFTLDAGIVADIDNMVRLMVVGQNLLDTKAIREAPRTITAGIAAQFDEFEIGFDAVFDIQTNPDKPLISYHVGAQYLIKEIVVIRLGFVYDGPTKEKRIAAGASYISKLLGVDVGFQQGLDRTDDTIFSLGVKVFLP